ncbi:MAG: SURF1 family protein [Alphaproteobacteria bacterium]|jgi:surfeit locus 1 family protein|nr:SURF1 family protein [Alphaproteobacteria bacterium]MBT4083389.1 SURF1 family protein [Alphaproteobacteria bacterium]MBT4542959.1 SURF1 family protein [Alphaproteobacteria bacterium]MBT5920255.1 SURF1 family protein [Alphaproteobacteria bacterium]MBT6384459.1 SURF1 family protein [Alphaproteobacteria bacterium]
MNIRSLVWPLVFTIPAVLILLTMGFWQLERLAWKEQLIAERATALVADPVLLPSTADDLQTMNFRRVFVTGHFLHAKAVHLQNRNHNGVRGVDVITPLKRTASEGGGLVLVNRGWVPLAKLEMLADGNNSAGAIKRLSGVVRLGARGRNDFTPDNVPEKSSWYSVDPAAMAQVMEIDVPPLVLDADQVSKPGEYPVSGLSHYDLKNNHLSYALTWFALAAALMVIFGLFAWRLREQD